MPSPQAIRESIVGTKKQALVAWPPSIAQAEAG
jgi:hypothetical protein